jgi:hypothetical protein
MANDTRPVRFRDYLPGVFRADEVDGVNFLGRFLRAFEALFEELEAAIEGTPSGSLELAAQSGSGTTVTVAPFNVGPVGFPIGTPVTVPDKALLSSLGQAIPANGTGLTHIGVQDESFVAALELNDVLHVHPGGIPDLFNPDTTPPPQFRYSPQPDFDYLNYVASWVALPLRAEKPLSFNRAFFHAAIPFSRQRSTLVGMEKLLRAWLKGDLLETSPTDPPFLIVTDLTRTHNDVDTIFQLAPEEASGRVPGEIYAQLGVNTVLGEGPPFVFIVDLLTEPALRELRHPVGLDVFQRAARFLLDAEKPAYTYYQLRVRAHTMQLAPPPAEEIEGEIYAQVGETTLLWGEPWVFDSEG